MITIFQLEYQPSFIEPDPVKYLERERMAIALAGHLFEYLGLAKFDRKSPLGWRPTQQMMELIESKGERSAKYPGKHREEAEEYNLAFVLTLLEDEVFGRDRPIGLCGLGFHVLLALSLTWEDDFGEWIPTPELMGLFCDGYCRRFIANRQKTGAGSGTPEFSLLGSVGKG
jgi:hypothetical protein